MKAVRWVINFICATTIIFVGLYFVVSVAISVFILSGQLTTGQPMYSEMLTPSLVSLLMYQATSAAILIVCILIRAKVGKKYDFKFLQPKSM